MSTSQQKIPLHFELSIALAERVTPIFAGGHPCNFLPEHHGGWMGQLPQIVALVERLARTSRPPFRLATVKTGPWLRTEELGQQLRDVLRLPIEQVRGSLTLYKFDPRLELFWAESEHRTMGVACMDGEWAQPGQVRSYVDRANGFVQSVRQGHNRRAFQNKVEAHVRASQAAYASLNAYLQALLELHPNLLPVTFELSYVGGVPASTPAIEQGMRVTAQHADDLIKRVKTVYGDAVVGHAWCQDAVLGIGNSCHVLLLLNGVSPEEIQSVVTAVCAMWSREVTDGDGCAYSGLATADPRFHYRALTHEDRRYLPKSEQLRHMAVYMRLTDRFMAVKAAHGVKIHGMGVLPKTLRETSEPRRPDRVNGPPLASVYPFPVLQSLTPRSPDSL